MGNLRSLSVYTGSLGVGVGYLWTLDPCLGFLTWYHFPVLVHLGHSSLKTPHPILFWVYCPTPKENGTYQSSLGETLWIISFSEKHLSLLSE